MATSSCAALLNIAWVLVSTAAAQTNTGDLDLVPAKSIRLGAPTLELRWQAFNALNRANFDLPNCIFGTPNFGRIFSAKTAREMQFGAKLTF